jgi:hypothetical protein
VASLSNILIGIAEIAIGAFLLATGVGGGIGVKLLLAGTLTLITSFMGAPAGRNGLSSSATYSFANLGNAQSEGSPVTVLYGEHKIKPGIISVALVQSGTTQKLRLLCLLGCGPIFGLSTLGSGSSLISQIRLNDVPLEQFTGATWDQRTGTPDQTVIPGFNETGAQYGAGTRLENTQKHVHDMKAAADAVVLDLAYAGFFAVGSTGKPGAASSLLKIEYKPVTSGDGSYSAFPVTTEDGTAWTKPSGGAAGMWETWSDRFGNPSTSLGLLTLLRFDGKNGRPPRGRYTIRVTGNGPAKTNATNTPTLQSVIEVNNDGRTYAGFALLGIEVPASAQLNGIPTISCVVKGRLVLDPRTGLTAWSDNPVLCVRDLITNTSYGNKTAESKLPAAAWNAAADICDQQVTPVAGGSAEARHRLDYVVDTQSPISDHAKQMLDTCDMTLCEVDRKVYVVTDSAKATATAFDGRATRTVADRIANGGGIRDDSTRSTLVASSLELSQRYTKIQLQYVDRNRDWQPRVVTIFDQYINVGAVAGGTFGVGNKIKGTTSKAVGRLTASYVNGARYLTFTQDDSATPFVTGETVTDLTSGASATTSSAPYTLAPERQLDIQMYGITRRSQAIRRARKMLNDCRSRTTFATWGGFIGDLNLLPGEVPTISADHLPWTARPFLLLQTGCDAQGFATFHGREYVADVYQDNVDTTQVDALAFIPGGSVPPGLRAPSDSVPSSSGSSSNASNAPSTSTGKSADSKPFGSVSVLSVSVSQAGAVAK